jgi:hypothetical protein
VSGHQGDFCRFCYHGTCVVEFTFSYDTRLYTTSRVVKFTFSYDTRLSFLFTKKLGSPEYVLTSYFNIKCHSIVDNFTTLHYFSWNCIFHAVSGIHSVYTIIVRSNSHKYTLYCLILTVYYILGKCSSLFLLRMSTFMYK